MSLILIADDHPITRDPLAKLLRYEGYETVGAANGLEALAALQARRPDLILLDMMMPKMGGARFLEAVREPGAAGDPPLVPPTVPIIVLTGVPDTSEVQRAKAMGVADVIQKAKFSVDELLTRIRTHLPPTNRHAPADPATEPDRRANEGAARPGKQPGEGSSRCGVPQFHPFSGELVSGTP